MLAGRLRDRIKILERSTVDSALGQSETWVERETRWGRITFISTSTRAQFQQAFNSDVTHRVTFRDPVPLSLTDNRVEVNGVQYEVISREVSPDNLDKFTRVEVRPA